ncbi:hypothetical protein BCV70DRAFT_199551 [Testicularia cyperi]|uniref:Uncharacterized protein n=1 Tax=Testicularia cyperi TaxID=1882483 RepID=A0A317XUY9_9BASI|nr:hypothetical protein BCV70DRAFT_199551 [Testicularia cyperi]
MDGFQIPDYVLSQDDAHVYIDISCTAGPVGSSSTKPALAVEDRIFGFRLDSFYLPLVLPHPVHAPIETPTASQTTATETATESSIHFRVRLPKHNKGQVFQDLDLLQPQILPDDQLQTAINDAQLNRGFFATPPNSGNQPVSSTDYQNAVTTTTTTTTSSSLLQDTGSGAEIDEAARSLLHRVLQNQNLTTVTDDDGGEAQLYPSSSSSSSIPPSSVAASTAQPHAEFGYGPGGVLSSPLIPPGCVDARGILEVVDPTAVSPAQRMAIAESQEHQHWDEGIYMDNFLDQEGEIEHLLQFQPFFSTTTATQKDGLEDGQGKEEEEEEEECSAGMDVDTACLLVELLFGLSYDERTNLGDPTVESGWTIAKLSRCLSASCTYSFLSPPVQGQGQVSMQAQPHPLETLETTLPQVVRACLRRSLSYPLYRHWQLSIQCLHDVISLLTLSRRMESGKGKSGIKLQLRCIHDRLNAANDAILSRLAALYIPWLLNHIPSHCQLVALANQLQHILDTETINKQTVGGEAWDLEVLELAARQALDDGDGGFV